MTTEEDTLIEVSKRQLRTFLLRNRRNLSSQEKNDAALTICNKSRMLSSFQRSYHLGFYLAHDNEVNLNSLLLKSLKIKKCYLPVLQNNHYLNFYSYHEKGLMTTNCFGIKEPEITQENLIVPINLDLIFLPLVAFDKHGNRLGRGGGYYDRTFAFLKKKNQ